MASATDHRPLIVVFEDDATLRALFDELFTEEGYRVSVHCRHLADLGELAALDPRIILLDMLMPGPRSSLEYLAALKADPRTAHVPVCPCTAAAHLRGTIRQALTAVDCRPVDKPFDVNDLLGEITHCLAKQSDPP